MFESLRKCLTGMACTSFSSSTPHRNAQRANVGADIIGTVLETFDPAAAIPTNLAQTLISFYSVFRFDTHASEKLVHLLQGSMAGAQMGLRIALLFNGVQCEAYTDDNLCTAIFLLSLLYKGTLLASWGPSEFSKDPYVQPASESNESEVEPARDRALSV
ncbi:hypothetical protein EP47_06425 [Legionella norrlandica]|uniref:Uncharacterized protein n=1 Tax=Legionella norrlandica TaxID=1498499 RepID=A0A0A2SR40_9GAMM|nr:hypothetical protein [Legionella norrlandica]KGP63590.1 hypothetical protein EP47_06425 [Legionella norrlandica]